MPSHYLVVQYVPDLVRDERVNIGVIAVGNGKVRTHFLENWQRVRHFGSKGIAALKEFAHQSSRLSEEDLRNAAANWKNVIQFTQPAASLLDVDQLVIDAAERFLVDPPTVCKPYRTRSDAARLTRQLVTSALRERLGGIAREFVRPTPLQGRYDEHEFDVTVSNGQPMFAAHGLSFEAPPTKDLAKELHATSWSIEDVRQTHPNLSIAIIALPPKGNFEPYERARRVFTDLGALVVPEEQATGWAAAVANEVGQHVK
jgi:hypothetical protein